MTIPACSTGIARGDIELSSVPDILPALDSIWDIGVAIDLKAVEQLATDQSSLKAAAGLAKPAKWSGVGMSRDAALIWGECAGSGANPYRVMAICATSATSAPARRANSPASTCSACCG